MIDTSKFVNKDMKDKLNLTIKALAGGIPLIAHEIDARIHWAK
jgi:hypothetical protein